MTVKKYDLQRPEVRNKFIACTSFHRRFDHGTPKFCTDTNNTQHDDNTSLSYFQLFRYATLCEKLLIILGFTLSTISSFGIPYSIMNSGEFHTLLIERHAESGTSSETYLLRLFGGGNILTNASKEENMAALRQDARAFGIATFAGAIFEWTLLAISVDIFNRIAVKQTNRIRKLFLRSVISQDMSWYDTTSNNNFASKMTEDLSKLNDGIGEKVAIFTNLVMSFISTVILSFFFGWKLILIMMLCCPVIIAATILVGRIQSNLTEKELRTYSNAGAVAEEVFRGIRTVFAFSGERKESERYNQLLVPATKAGHEKGLYIGMCAGAMWVIIYTCFALSLYFAARKAVVDGKNELPAIMVTLLLGIILEAQSVGLALPHLESFSAAKSAAESIFSIIDRKTAIDPLSEEGLKSEEVVGDIDFENVHFRYPSRPDVEVLKGLSVSIKAGQTVAFVGPSGCGKTTCLQLLQRFYDPESGSVQIDGIDIGELNVAWLRSLIAVVGQEPVLFSTTIGDNIRYGNPGISQEEIEEACKMAYCHNFITQFPDGYNTMVGEMGSKMSGGQKQRIAIARALAKKPKILLLDEATSALDSANEKLVQDALEAACKGRTTLIVAHRLSTVRDADRIVFIKDGVVMEQGSHDDLMALKGHYYGLMKARKRENLTPSDGRLSKTPSKTVLQESQPDVSKNNEKSEVKQSSKEKKGGSLRRFFRLNAPDWKYILLGCTAAILQGSTGSIWAFYFGEFIGFMSDLNNDFEEKAAKIAIIAVVIGLLAGIANLFQIFMLNVAGANLTSRLRQMAFKAIVSQDVSYFDDQTNSVGALCSRLGGDCCNVQEATGSRFGIMIQSLSTLVIAIIMSLVFSWNLTLLTLIMVPLVVGSIILEATITEKSFNEEILASEKASQVAVEAVTNIRTINSLGQEKYVLERYSRQIDLGYEASKGKTRYRGLVFGFGDASQCIAFGISLFYGGLLVADGDIEFKNIIKISEALQLGTMMLAQAFAYAPDVNEAKLSVQRLLKLFDRVPAIQSPSEQLVTENSNDDISFKSVGFQYPSRKTVPVLQNFNLEIPKGTSIALVGSSGCGKSTCVQLLLRYYDPSTGIVSINGVETKDYQLETLRSQIGLVSQEPVLFDRTIAENIAYGDNFRETIPMSEIIEAAKNSNIHDFIVALPEGYDTSLSSKGAQLSCGQKQRIAIARALVRNPKVLILDEATSALDMQSEKIVQEALDNACSGRTSIIIAQRLATVRNADLICVVRNGFVQEKGTHDELVQLNGIYAELLRMQE